MGQSCSANHTQDAQEIIANLQSRLQEKEHALQLFRAQARSCRTLHSNMDDKTVVKNLTEHIFIQQFTDKTKEDFFSEVVTFISQLKHP